MEFDKWLTDSLPKYDRLTQSVESMVRSLIEAAGIEYLSISGRTKTSKSINDKIDRKSYKDPANQLTDISGVRIILFIESDLNKVEELISNSFEVDTENSSNKDQALGANQVGYRSIHFVCELGRPRTKLPEYKDFKGMKFEFQVRTVLQHAWAELAHDRSYKFKSELPKDIQRKLFLHAGLLEIADKGFSEIASEIDSYAEGVSQQYKSGDLNVPINSISVTEFMDEWALKHDVEVRQNYPDTLIKQVLHELKAFGVDTIQQLNNLCPKNYVEEYMQLDKTNSLIGVVRDWMVIADPDKIVNVLNVDWKMPSENWELARKLSSQPDADVWELLLRKGLAAQHTKS